MFAELANDPPVCTGISRLASLHDLLKIGIGPSSSHTIGPMKAAGLFRQSLEPMAARVASIHVRLYGSLAWTGTGHDTDKAVLLGLAGEVPENIDPDEAELLVARIQAESAIPWSGGRPLPFSTGRDLSFDHTILLGHHPNTMRFDAFDASGATLLTEWWSSIGGGFVVKDGASAMQGAERRVPYPYESAEELLAWGRTAECAPSPRSRLRTRSASALRRTFITTSTAWKRRCWPVSRAAWSAKANCPAG